MAVLMRKTIIIHMKVILIGFISICIQQMKIVVVMW